MMTGTPKGIKHSHSSALRNFEYILTTLVHRGKAAFTTNFFHVGGFMNGMWGLIRGCSMNHLSDRGFTVEKLANMLAVLRPATITVGPHHYIELSESESIEKMDPKLLDSIKAMMPVGAAEPEICETNLKARFTKLKVLMPYLKNVSILFTSAFMLNSSKKLY